jgi:galactoside 2-L-fucosyltransferase 1/2
MKLREPGWGIYGRKTEQLPDRNVSLTVFLQSWKYFIHVEDQLRIDFTFKQRTIDKARRFLNSKIPPEWRDLDFVRVAIHVRRGDYVNKGLQSFGWALPEPDYFNRSMAYFADCLPRIQFVVLSNDMKWCRRNIFGPNVVYSGFRNPTDDMAIASLCDHAIISIGSYGWWAAWFANGVTVTQKNFPTPKSKLLKKLSRTDYYKPDWVAL